MLLLTKIICWNQEAWSSDNQSSEFQFELMRWTDGEYMSRHSSSSRGSASRPKMMSKTLEFCMCLPLRLRGPQMKEMSPHTVTYPRAFWQLEQGDIKLIPQLHGPCVAT